MRTGRSLDSVNVSWCCRRQDTWPVPFISPFDFIHVAYLSYLSIVFKLVTYTIEIKKCRNDNNWAVVILANSIPTIEIFSWRRNSYSVFNDVEITTTKRSVNKRKKICKKNSAIDVAPGIRTRSLGVKSKPKNHRDIQTHPITAYYKGHITFKYTGIIFRWFRTSPDRIREKLADLFGIT